LRYSIEFYKVFFVAFPFYQQRLSKNAISKKAVLSGKKTKFFPFCDENSKENIFLIDLLGN